MCLFCLRCSAKTEHHAESQRGSQTDGGGDGAKARTADRAVTLGGSLGIFRVTVDGAVMMAGDELEKTGESGESCESSKGRAEEKLRHDLTGSS